MCCEDKHEINSGAQLHKIFYVLLNFIFYLDYTNNLCRHLQVKGELFCITNRKVCSTNNKEVIILKCP